MLSGEADAARAVCVGQAVDAVRRPQVAVPAGALGVLAALDAAAACEVAHPDGAVGQRKAVDTHAAGVVAVPILTAIEVLDALATEPPQLRAATRRGWAGVHLHAAGGRTSGPQGIADFSGGAGDLGAGGAGPAQPVRGDAVAVGARETDAAHLVGLTRTGAETAVRQHDASGARPGALGVHLTARAGRLSEGEAAPGGRFAVLRLGAFPRKAAVGLLQETQALTDVAPLAEGTIVLRATMADVEDASAARQVTRAAGALRVGVAFPRRGIPVRAHQRIRLILVASGATAQEAEPTELQNEDEAPEGVSAPRGARSRQVVPDNGDVQP